MCKKEKCDILLDKHNIHSNASAMEMHTNYYLISIPNNLEFMLKYLTSAIINPNITKKLLNDEKEAVRNELNMFINNPSWEMYDKMYKAFYKPSGYRMGADYKHQLALLDKLNVSDMKRFLNKTRINDCLLFTISGKFDRKLIINFFNSIPRLITKESCKMKLFKPINHCFSLEKKTIFVKSSKFANTNILIYFPIYLKQGSVDIIGLKFLQSVLADGLNSILLKRLRLDLNLVYSLSISINTDDCGTTLSISTETIDKNAKKVISEIFRLIKKYKKTLLTKEKIENTKRTWIMSINNICLTKPQEVSEYYKNQYFWQLNKEKKDIITIAQLIKHINSLDKYKLKKLINDFLNVDKCVLTYGAKNKVV